jgi:hypothetical protein
MRQLRPKQLLVLAAVLLVGVFASGAAAAKPTKGACTLCNPSGSFPAGLVCPFAFSFEDVVDHRFQITYSNGVIKIAGYRVLRVTNEDTQESRTFQLNAMITFFFEGARVVTTSHGPFLWGFFAGDLGEGQPAALFYTRGFAREIDEYPGPHPNPFGLTTLSFEVRGSSENLCETMA